MISVLPKVEHTFSIKVTGTETQQLFEGQFVYKKPTLRAKSDIAKTEALLNGGMDMLDSDTKFVHSVLATLKHTLVKSPDWWIKADFGFELYDINVILEVYKACADFETKWQEELHKSASDEAKK